MSKKSHHDDPAPERADEIKEELHHLDEVEASLHTNEPMFGQPAPEGADVASPPLDTPHPTLAVDPGHYVSVIEPHHADLNELMAGWWKEAKQLTLDPVAAGEHFATYAAARGWSLVETPQDKSRS